MLIRRFTNPKTKLVKGCMNVKTILYLQYYVHFQSMKTMFKLSQISSVRLLQIQIYWCKICKTVKNALHIPLNITIMRVHKSFEQPVFYFIHLHRQSYIRISDRKIIIIIIINNVPYARRRHCLIRAKTTRARS